MRYWMACLHNHENEENMVYLIIRSCLPGSYYTIMFHFCFMRMILSFECLLLYAFD